MRGCFFGMILVIAPLKEKIDFKAKCRHPNQENF